LVYCTVSITTPELVTWWVCRGGGGVLPAPPQLEFVATAETSRVKHAVSKKHFAFDFLVKNSRGNRRMGMNTVALARPGKVSVKTTMI
jgi:hypothetical protein